jgi:hypothetical protein
MFAFVTTSSGIAAPSKPPGLTLLDALCDTLLSHFCFGWPPVLVSQETLLGPDVRRVAHIDDEDLAAVGILVGAVGNVPPEHVIAGPEVLSRHAHPPLGDQNRVPARVGVLGLDVARRERLLQVEVFDDRVVVQHVIAEFAKRFGVETPLFSATIPLYAAAVARLGPRQDSAAVCAVLQEMADGKHGDR